MSQLVVLRNFEFNGQPIRAGGSPNRPYVLLADAAAALGIVYARDAVAAFDDDEKGVVITDILGGKQRATVLYEPGLYRLAFQSRKPEAAAFRRWVLHEVLPEIRRTGGYRAKQRAKYERLGQQEFWIEERESGIQERKGFTDTLKDHGVTTGPGYAICTDAIYHGLYGNGAKMLRVRMGLSAKASLRDHLDAGQLSQVRLSEFAASDKIKSEHLHGTEQCSKASRLAGDTIRQAMDIIRKTQVN